MVTRPVFKFKQCFIRSLLGVCGLSLASMSYGVLFESALETTQWKTETSIFACKLYQPVDLYGEAVFLRRAGEAQRFYLQENNQQLAPGEATIFALTPKWSVVSRSEVLDKVTIKDDKKPIQIDWLRSQNLAESLQNGQRLLFTHTVKYGEKKPLQVILEPIRFRVAFDQFQACLAALLPVNYDQVHRTALYFSATGDEFEQFSQLQKKQLDNLVRYTLADKYVTALKIDGHTDSKGLRQENLDLSKRRAEIVSEYLVERGIPEAMITTRWHGERYPKISNSTVSGRAKNRRVTVRLDRFEKDFPAIADRYTPKNK